MLRQGDLADTPVSGWLFADSITVTQMMIVILCISSQVINVTRAFSASKTFFRRLPGLNRTKVDLENGVLGGVSNSGHFACEKMVGAGKAQAYMECIYFDCYCFIFVM